MHERMLFNYELFRDVAAAVGQGDAVWMQAAACSTCGSPGKAFATPEAAVLKGSPVGWLPPSAVRNSHILQDQFY